MTFDIQIASDLHLEYNKIDAYNDIIKPSAPILVLAGDIGNLYEYEKLKHFLQWCCDNFVAVVFIPGNHEFYTPYKTVSVYKYELEFILHKINSLIPNLYILSRGCIEINNIYFIGCTLWTNFREKYLPKYIVKIKDYNKYKYNKEHFKDIKYIQRALKLKKKCIIITHHPPINHVQNPKKKNFKSLYYNNFENLIKQNPHILTWICGHTHKNFDIVINKTRIVTNQFGKPQDNITDYKDDFVISL